MPLPNIPEPTPGPFERFHRRWLGRLEELRQLLLQEYRRLGQDGAGRGQGEEDEARVKELVRTVAAHYADYFRVKQTVVREDVLILFAPPWITPLERTLLWIGGFKPGFAFRVVLNYVTNLTDDQKRRLARVMAETAQDEETLSAEFSRMRAGSSALSLVELVTRTRERMNGESNSTDERVQILKAAAKMLIERADLVRCRTVARIMEILDSYQNLKFLLAIVQLQVRLRSWGLHRQAHNNNNNDNNNQQLVERRLQLHDHYYSSPGFENHI